MMLYCPTCGKKVEDNYQVPETEPFTATNPMLGLQVWGPYSSEKNILCQGRTWVHFQTNCEERLVQLGVPLTEPFGPDGYIEEEDSCGYGSGPDDDDDYWKEGDDDMPF